METRMKLGMVTYNMGKDMDLDGLIAFCETVGLEGVELRTGHAHGVELALSSRQRADVRRRFEDSAVAIAGMGTACEFHSPDTDEVHAQVEEAKAFSQLAADVGAPGIKVRPNGIRPDIGPDATCEQIGRALAEVARHAAGLGVEVRLEVHGRESSQPALVRKMMDAAAHPNARVCWNSNAADMDGSGSIAESFDLLKDFIGLVHITEIGTYTYPWQDLFDRLSGIGYTGFCLAEIQYNPEPERFMKYYRTLFDLYTGHYSWPRD